MCNSFRTISYVAVDEWEARLRIKFNTNVFTPEEVLNLLDQAGHFEGVGFRCISQGYNHGAFRVVSNPPPRVHYLHGQEQAT